MSLDGVRTFNLGTSEAKSAVKYDALEMRRIVSDLVVDAMAIPSAVDLLRGDVWKLGAVFVEMLTFLVWGTAWVHGFRTFLIPKTGRIRSDGIRDITSDDGVKAKPQVAMAKMKREFEVLNLVRFRSESLKNLDNVRVPFAPNSFQ